MPEDPKLYGVEYKINELRPPLTRAEVVQARKDRPKTGFCRAGIVLALMGPGALIVETCESRGDGADPMSGQRQFEMWLLWTQQLAASGSVPAAMQNFLGRVLSEYRAECAR